MAAREEERIQRLEDSIKQLKSAKVSLVKQQRAETAKHKEWMEAKNREISQLKKSALKKQQQVNFSLITF